MKLLLVVVECVFAIMHGGQPHAFQLLLYVLQWLATPIIDHLLTVFFSLAFLSRGEKQQLKLCWRMAIIRIVKMECFNKI